MASSITTGVREYIKGHKFWTLEMCSRDIGFNVEQVRGAMQQIRKEDLIEYNHRIGYYVPRGYNKNFDEGAKRQRLDAMSDARSRYVMKMRAVAEVLRDQPYVEPHEIHQVDEDGVPYKYADGDHPEFSWERLERVKRHQE